MTTKFWLVVLAVFALFLAFIVGLALGMVVLGWMLFPVQWIDASPADLAQPYKYAYIVNVADAYSVNHDLGRAQQSLTGLSQDEISRAIRDEIQTRNKAGRLEQASALIQFAQDY